MRSVVGNIFISVPCCEKFRLRPDRRHAQQTRKGKCYGRRTESNTSGPATSGAFSSFTSSQRTGWWRTRRAWRSWPAPGGKAGGGGAARGGEGGGGGGRPRRGGPRGGGAGPGHAAPREGHLF